MERYIHVTVGVEIGSVVMFCLHKSVIAAVFMQCEHNIVSKVNGHVHWSF